MYLAHLVVTIGTGGLGNRKTSGDHPDYSIVEISQNSENNSGGGARGVMVIVAGNRHGDTSSNPGRD